MRVNIKKNLALINEMENKGLRVVTRLIHNEVCSRMNTKNLELEVAIPRKYIEIMDDTLSVYLKDCEVVHKYYTKTVYRLCFYDYNQFIIDIANHII